MIQYASHHAASHQPINPDAWRIDAGLWTRVRNVLAFVALVAWVATIAGWVLDPRSFYQSYLFAFCVTVGIPIGALFFVMVQYLTGSAWSVTMRRISENLMVTFPMTVVLFVPVALGVRDLYSWTRPPVQGLIGDRTAYLNEQAWLIRAAIYFILWIVWSTAIYRHSVRQDVDGSIGHMHGASRWSAPGLLMLFLSASLAAVDWIMSLQPTWYSTMWGIYYLTGAALGFMCIWTMVCLGLRNARVLVNEIRVEHYHDLGKWLFTLTCFWGYIGFSQYMLIWYGNLPEETVWFRMRSSGVFWNSFFILLVWGHFILPFVLLMMRAAKRNMKMLWIMSIWLLVMEIADVYFMIMPVFNRAFPLHWLDFACVLATMSALGLAFWFRMKSHSLIAAGDPRLLQGLEFENV